MGSRRPSPNPNPNPSPNASQGTELPTFNSNAINAALHRIPGLAPWFVYSDDDILFANPKQTLGAWWDHGGVVGSAGGRRSAPHDAGGHQKLYFQDSFVRATQPRRGNKWEDSMRYMAGLLDALPRPLAQVRV